MAGWSWATPGEAEGRVLLLVPVHGVRLVPVDLLEVRLQHPQVLDSAMPSFASLRYPPAGVYGLFFGHDVDPGLSGDVAGHDVRLVVQLARHVAPPPAVGPVPALDPVVVLLEVQPPLPGVEVGVLEEGSGRGGLGWQAPVVRSLGAGTVGKWEGLLHALHASHARGSPGLDVGPGPERPSLDPVKQWRKKGWCGGGGPLSGASVTAGQGCSILEKRAENAGKTTRKRKTFDDGWMGQMHQWGKGTRKPLKEDRPKPQWRGQSG